MGVHFTGESSPARQYFTARTGARWSLYCGSDPGFIVEAPTTICLIRMACEVNDAKP